MNKNAINIVFSLPFIFYILEFILNFILEFRSRPIGLEFRDFYLIWFYIYYDLFNNHYFFPYERHISFYLD